MITQADIAKANVRLEAAKMLSDCKLQEFLASVMVSEDLRDLDTAHTNAVSAYSAWLDMIITTNRLGRQLLEQVDQQQRSAEG